MSNFQVGHGGCGAIGFAADVLYCAKVGLLKEEADRVLDLLQFGLKFIIPTMPKMSMEGPSFWMVWKNSVSISVEN